MTPKDFLLLQSDLVFSLSSALSSSSACDSLNGATTEQKQRDDGVLMANAAHIDKQRLYRVQDKFAHIAFRSTTPTPKNL